MKRGHSNHKRLLYYGAEFISEIKTVEGYGLTYFAGMDFGISCLIKQQKGVVHGELYRISNITPINKFEGHPYVYCLSQLGLWDGNMEIKAFGYLYSYPEDFNCYNSVFIEDGNFQESFDYKKLLKTKINKTY